MPAATNPQDLTPSATSVSPKKKTAEQIRRIAERRRERKDEARTPRQRAAEQTIQDLIWALDRIPAGEDYDEYRDELNRAVSRIRKIGARTPDRAAAAVTRALADPLNALGGATLADLVGDTGIPEREVRSILDGMCALGTACRRRPKDEAEAACGPKSWRYSLVDRAPRTDMVLP